MVKDIQSWQILVKRLSINIHNFCRRYLVMSLTNNSNLKRWTISNSELCSLCTKKQTFNHCLQALNRYMWRHNSIIRTFCDHLLKPRDTVQITTTKSHNYRSATKRSITPCETRYCHLVNIKRLDIKKLKASLLTPPSNFQLIFLEMTSLGFVTKNIKTFRNFLRSININERYLIEKLQEVVIRCLYFIYCRRIKKLERA